MTESSVLNADDVAALKLAETVSFHYYKGRGYIRLSVVNRSFDDQRIYSAREQRLFPNADGSARNREILVGTRMQGYGVIGDEGRGWNLDTSPSAVAFDMIHTPTYNAEWMTIVSLFRTGDVLTCVWVADNNSETIRKASLHVDKLSIEIVRGKTNMRLHVATSITPDNSARMIRQHG